MSKKIALVLSGGGARGLAHIGVIEELLQRNYDITSIAGTSMGSVVAGVYALGKLDEFRDWTFSMNKKKVFNLVDFTLSKQGMVRGEKVFKEMKKLIPDSNIEDLPIPYAAVAVDIISKEEIVFTKGSLYDAIRASVSIPTVFTPVKTDHKLLIDGGVLNNIPVDHVSREKGDQLFVVNVNANTPPFELDVPEKDKKEKESRYKKRTKAFYKNLKKVTSSDSEDEDLGYFNLISRTLDLMTWRIDELMMEKQSPDLLIEISRETSAIWDFYKAEELVDIGRALAIKQLDEFEKDQK